MEAACFSDRCFHDSWGGSPCSPSPLSTPHPPPHSRALQRICDPQTLREEGCASVHPGCLLCLLRSPGQPAWPPVLPVPQCGPFPLKARPLQGPCLLTPPAPYTFSCHPPNPCPPHPDTPHCPYFGSSRGAGHQPVPPSLDFSENLRPVPVSLRLQSHRLDSSSRLQGLNVKQIVPAPFPWRSGPGPPQTPSHFQISALHPET